MAKAKAKGKTKDKFGIKEPQVVVATERKKPTGKPPKRIRMLMSCANQDRSYTTGKSYDVPQEVPVDTARSWLASGAAEEDMSLEGPEETK